MKDATIDYVDELTRLGVLSDDVDLSGVPGFEFAYDGLTYEVEQANHVSGWWRSPVVNSRSVRTPPSCPSATCCSTVSTSTPTRGRDTTTVDIAEVADEELQVAVVEDDGAFYVSSFYTVAELAASSEGYTLPATPIPAVGAESPEAAVRGMIDAALDLDVGRVIELTPPDEMAALHDYGPILVELADEAIAESDIESELDGWTISIDTLDFEQVEVSGGIKLLPTRIAVERHRRRGSSSSRCRPRRSTSRASTTPSTPPRSATTAPPSRCRPLAGPAPPTSRTPSRTPTCRSRCSRSPSGWSASSDSSV